MAIRVAANECDLVLGGDMVVVGQQKVLSDRPSSAGHHDGDQTRPRSSPATYPQRGFPNCRPSGCGPAPDPAPRRAPRRPVSSDATRLATALLAIPIWPNIFMVGYAYPARRGACRFSAGRDRAARSELNGEAVADEILKSAFQFGPSCPRTDAASVEALVKPAPEFGQRGRAAAVAEFRRDGRAARDIPGPHIRNAGLCGALPDAGRKRWRPPKPRKAPGQTGPLRGGRAAICFKLMAYKDEYEVARLVRRAPRSSRK